MKKDLEKSMKKYLDEVNNIIKDYQYDVDSLSNACYLGYDETSYECAMQEKKLKTEIIDKLKCIFKKM